MTETVRDASMNRQGYNCGQSARWRTNHQLEVFMIRQRIAPTKTAWLSPARELAAEAEVARLPPNEAAVVRMHFGLGERPRTIVETAAARGLSAGQVRRLQACALKRLRWRSWAAEEVAES